MNTQNYIIGYFHKNTNGRLQLIDHEVTCGTQIEYFNRENEAYEWVPSRIEHTNGDYYIYDLPGIDPKKMKVRISEEK
ncbi:DUF5348 domain-containing protein [Bacillus toyonensis]|uniref:DUF5348 domain-containing protein n=1 Tax=Bacillus toyonensis TaxID=155322 RepID=UPI000BF0F319|nr:DUF5348 domain-containing protein [Bacillus toyonensis]PEK30524.1 hypothetical protein CN897_27290 [Bacillus toyonensis]